MNSNTKRKNRTNTNSYYVEESGKMGNTGRNTRNKGSIERNVVVDGVYCNARFMHTATSLVGCNVQVQTQNGNVFEGIFRTFSQQFDIVLEMAHKLDITQVNKITVPTKEALIEKLVIRLPDVVMVTAQNADLEYATKDSFATDTAISKFNGQIVERELEPWEGAAVEEDIPALDTESANGWDPNDMFRTNEQQYGVQSTYDHSLAGYTIPLERKNTDEYKKQEAKATKIASEIESSPSYRARIALENGDEEDKFSAVIRPDNSIVGKYVPPAKRKSSQSGKLTRTPSSPQQNSHCTISPAKSHVAAHPQHQLHSAQPPTQHNIHSPHVQQMSAQHQQTHAQPGAPHQANQYVVPQQQSTSPHPQAAVTTAQHHSHPQSTSTSQTQGPHQQPMKATSIENEIKINGEKIDKEEKKMENENIGNNESREPENKVLIQETPTTHIANKIDRKNSNPKARDEQIAELKKFSTDFKLLEENKDTSNKQDQAESKEKAETEMEKISNTLKKSNLNPNAKEFVLNPNAKAFTPVSRRIRSPNTQTPTPPRPHTPSTVIAQPATMQIMPQPIFTSLPAQYIMSGPVSVSLAPPFNPATMQQPPRMRKAVPPSVHQPRHEFSQVAAATGQPLLAPPTIPGHPHITVQYTHQGMVHTPGGQPTMHYPQVYSVVGPRMVTPQHIPLAPTSHAATYPDTQHVPNQVFVPAHPAAAVPTQLPPGATHPSANPMSTISGPHSTPPNQQGMPGQTQATGVHPSPSPVHQSPHGTAPNQPTPPATVGTPQPLVYQPSHVGQLGQPQLQPSPHTPNSPQTMHPNPGAAAAHNPHMHPNQVTHSSNNPHGGSHVSQPHPQHPGTPGPTGYPTSAGHQPMVLIPQQGHTATLSTHPQAVPTGHTFQGPLHGPGTPGPVAHIMSHSSLPVPVIPATSGAATMSTHPQIHYIPHHAHSQPPVQPYPHTQ